MHELEQLTCSVCYCAILKKKSPAGRPSLTVTNKVPWENPGTGENGIYRFPPWICSDWKYCCYATATSITLTGWSHKARFHPVSPTNHSWCRTQPYRMSKGAVVIYLHFHDYRFISQFSLKDAPRHSNHLFSLKTFSIQQVFSQKKKLHEHLLLSAWFHVDKLTCNYAWPLYHINSISNCKLWNCAIEFVMISSTL